MQTHIIKRLSTSITFLTSEVYKIAHKVVNTQPTHKLKIKPTLNKTAGTDLHSSIHH